MKSSSSPKQNTLLMPTVWSWSRLMMFNGIIDNIQVNNSIGFPPFTLGYTQVEQLVQPVPPLTEKFTVINDQDIFRKCALRTTS